MADSSDEGVGGLGTKAGLTLVILVLMVPGLVVEPGPVSEVVGVAAIGAVWGFDLGGES